MCRLVAAVALTLALGACSSDAGGHAQPAPATTPAPASTTVATAARDPETPAALLRIARAFNDDYGRGDVGPVYDRWDAASQAIIPRAEYMRRHTLCATTPGTAHVEGVSRGTGGAWLVHYEIGGQQLTDRWFYRDGRWVFDLPLSNPDAARLYRMPFQQYAAAVGCAR